MDVFSKNVPSLLFGVVMPLSTMAVVAFGCGGNRQSAHKKKQANALQGKKSSRKRSKVSSSKKNCSHSSKSGSVSSSKLPDKAKRSSKEIGSKKDSKKVISSKHKPSQRKALSETSAVHKSNKPSVIPKKNVCIASSKQLSTEPLKSSSSKGNAQVPSVKGTQSSTQKSAKTQEQSRRQPHAAMHLEPNKLTFPTTGGLQQISVYNEDTGHRYAVKVKCSDNLLYRVNPVFSIVEPGKNLILNVYRNGTPSENIKMADKLVVVVAKVSKEENEPQNAFKNKDEKHQMMAIPLLISSMNAREVAGPAVHCPCIKTEC